jgi:ubiquinone/menaquinone biosynthesis C-methylase UbiE
VGLLQVYWHVLTSLGNALTVGKEADQLFRFYVINALEDIGLSAFLNEPRTYGEIVTRFGFEDGEYTRDVLSTLAGDSGNVIVFDGHQYMLNPKVPFPTLNGVLASTRPKLRPFALMAEGMSANILDRMREEKIGFAELFERDDRQLLSKFTTILGNQIYTSLRRAAFAYLSRQDRDWLQGRQLLDLGCGAGRETAEIWARYGGDIRITAIDPVPGMVEMAIRDFESLVGEADPKSTPVTGPNRPVFDVGSATRLPYPDDSFDACFWMLVLHYTPDPRKAISEVVRVVRPGGLIFGGQLFKPQANPYFDLVIRSSRNSYGAFWREDFRRWFAEHDLTVDLGTPVSFFRVRNEPSVARGARTRDRIRQ